MSEALKLDKASVFDAGLLCDWCSCSVVFDTMLKLEVPVGACTDMPGAIAFAKRVLPGVKTLCVCDTAGKMLNVYDCIKNTCITSARG